MLKAFVAMLFQIAFDLALKGDHDDPRVAEIIELVARLCDVAQLGPQDLPDRVMH